MSKQHVIICLGGISPPGIWCRVCKSTYLWRRCFGIRWCWRPWCPL